MGISIKRDETEQLAREVAALTGESLTETVHGALRKRLEDLKPRSRIREEEEAFIDALLERNRRRLRSDDPRPWSEVEETEYYDEHGQPIA